MFMLVAVRQQLNRLFGTAEPEPGPFFSKFGGLWIDRANAGDLLRARRRQGRVSRKLKSKISEFMRDGRVVLERAVPIDLVDRLSRTVTSAFERGHPDLLYQTDGAANLTMNGSTDPFNCRIVESHGVLPDVRAALGAPAIVEFLKAVFEETPVLTQSLIFQLGSRQSLHQDPIYVAFDEPLRMAACWIALEDIKAGSGELQYVIGSHRLPEHIFSNGLRAWHGADASEVPKVLDDLLVQSDRRGLKRETFLARKGDALIWHADLLHGGSPVTDAQATRQSLVGHFCPESVRPKYPQADVRQRDGEILYSSYIYDVGGQNQ